MSETEKYEQVGRLAEEYSHVKGKLNHIQERLNRAQQAYQLANQTFPSISVVGGKLATQNPYGNQSDVLGGLLSASELSEALTERQLLQAEVAEVANRLKALAPHLLP